MTISLELGLLLSFNYMSEKTGCLFLKNVYCLHNEQLEVSACNRLLGSCKEETLPSLFLR